MVYSWEEKEAEVIKNAFIEHLSGISELHEDGGIATKDTHGYETSISFPTNSPNYAIQKTYSNGIFYEIVFEGLKRKCLRQWEDGNLYVEENYNEHGQLHGVVKSYWKGKLDFKSYYLNDEQVSKSTYYRKRNK